MTQTLPNTKERLLASFIATLLIVGVPTSFLVLVYFECWKTSIVLFFVYLFLGLWVFIYEDMS